VNGLPRNPAPPTPFIRAAQMDDMTKEQTYCLISHPGFHSWHHKSLPLLPLFSSLHSTHYSPHFIRLHRHNHNCHWLCSANQGSCVISNLSFYSSRSFLCSDRGKQSSHQSARYIQFHSPWPRWHLRPMSRQSPVLHASRIRTLHFLMCAQTAELRKHVELANVHRLSHFNNKWVYLYKLRLKYTSKHHD
jgi:hypothetical protein